MTNIIQQLQNSAIDDAVDVSTLLRRSLLVAYKLGLSDFERWLTFELDGYRVVEVPAYRKVRGQVFVSGPRGSQPMTFADPQMADVVTAHDLRTPVGPLHDLLKSSTNAVFSFEFPPELQNLLMAPFAHLPGIPELRVSRSSLVMALDAVRNAILTWSLQLEKDGIKGDGLSFSPGEVAIARQHERDLQPPMIIVGSMTNSTIQQASPKATVS